MFHVSIMCFHDKQVHPLANFCEKRIRKKQQPRNQYSHVRRQLVDVSTAILLHNAVRVQGQFLVRVDGHHYAPNVSLEHTP